MPKQVIITTTPERLDAVRRELERQWIGDEAGRLISQFLDDVAEAKPPVYMPPV